MNDIGEIIGGFATFGLMLIMFSMGLALEVGDFVRVVTRPRAALIGLVGQLLLLPAVALAICLLLDLEPAVAIGLMVLSACPGGPTSNAISVMADGDAALSVTLTAISSFIAFLTAPFVIGLALAHFQIEGRSLSIPFVETSARIFFTTVVPVSLGMLLIARASWLGAHRTRIFAFGLSLVLGASALLLVGRSDLLNSWQAAASAVALNVTMMFLAYALARIVVRDEAASRSITIEVGLQNVSLALVIIVGSLQMAEALSPTLFYLPVAYVTGFGFALAARGRAPQMA